MKHQLKFPIQFEGIFQFSLALLIFSGLVFYGLADFSISSKVILSILLLRLLVYPAIDYAFPKTILLEDGKLYLKIAFLKIKIDREKALFVEEDVFIFIKSYGPITSINLYRNRHHIFGLSFKNKIHLNLMPSKEEVAIYFKQLETDFDVRCILAGGKIY